MLQSVLQFVVGFLTERSPVQSRDARWVLTSKLAVWVRLELLVGVLDEVVTR